MPTSIKYINLLPNYEHSKYKFIDVKLLSIYQ